MKPNKAFFKNSTALVTEQSVMMTPTKDPDLNLSPLKRALIAVKDMRAKLEAAQER